MFMRVCGGQAMCIVSSSVHVDVFLPWFLFLARYQGCFPEFLGGFARNCYKLYFSNVKLPPPLPTSPGRCSRVLMDFTSYITPTMSLALAAPGACGRQQEVEEAGSGPSRLLL